MPTRPIRNSRIQGVLGGGDGEMSYIDVNALRPESVSAAVLDGAMHGAVSGASMTAFPIGLGAVLWASAAKEAGAAFNWSPKPLWIGASIIAGTALIMGAVRAVTAGQQAKVHNAWSKQVLDHMQQREAAEAGHLTLPPSTQVEQVQAEKLAAVESTQRG